MKNYTYEYIIYTNNMGYGKMKITNGFATLKEAQNFLRQNGSLSSFGDCGYHNKYGCCDIIKKRKYIK